MLGLKLDHVGKRGPRSPDSTSKHMKYMASQLNVLPNTLNEKHLLVSEFINIYKILKFQRGP